MSIDISAQRDLLTEAERYHADRHYLDETSTLPIDACLDTQCCLADALAACHAEIARLTTACDNAVQQARIQDSERATQAGIVRDLGALVGESRDWEVGRTVAAELARLRLVETAGWDIVQNFDASVEFAGMVPVEQINALRAALAARPSADHIGDANKMVSDADQ